jgi:hypothetical protein
MSDPTAKIVRYMQIKRLLAQSGDEREEACLANTKSGIIYDFEFNIESIFYLIVEVDSASQLSFWTTSNWK